MSNVELKGFKGLRGLNDLVTDSREPKVELEQIEKLALDLLTPGKYQPRKNIDESVLRELADSIKTQGIIQPLIVRKIEQNKYEIIAGERRWRAARIAELTHVPVIVREIEDNVACAFALIENIQREDLNPIEEATAFARFRDEFSMTHDEIAHTVGRSRTSVTNTLRLLSLEASVRKLLEEGRLDMGHARALLTLDLDQQPRVAMLITDKQLNVREAEQLVNAEKYQQPGTVSENKEPQFYQAKCEQWSKELSKRFSAKVSVKLSARGTGKVVIEVASPDEIDWFVDHVYVK